MWSWLVAFPRCVQIFLFHLALLLKVFAVLQTGVCMGCSAGLPFSQVLSPFWLPQQEQKLSDPALLGWAGAGRGLARAPGRSSCLQSHSPRCSISLVAGLHSLQIPTCSGSPGVWLCWLQGVTRGSPQPFGHGVVFLKPHLLRHSCMECFFLLSSMTAACWSQSQASRLTCPWLHLSKK